MLDLGTGGWYGIPRERNPGPVEGRTSAKGAPLRLGSHLYNVWKAVSGFLGGLGHLTEAAYCKTFDCGLSSLL